MDYSIAFIMPSKLVSGSIKKFLEKSGYEYPVYASSSTDAVILARKLLPMGTRLIVSQGLTNEYLKQAVSIPTLEMPFSGLDALNAVKQALSAGKSARIIHVGTRYLNHFVQRSLIFLGEDPDRIDFCDLNVSTPILQQVDEFLNDYDVFIGGFITTDYVRKQGKIGIEFDVDESIIHATVLNAQSLVNGMLELEHQHEMDKAILRASADGIIALDQDRKIFDANLAALNIFRGSADTLWGKDLETVLKENNLVDVATLNAYPTGSSSKNTPVVLKEVPVIVDNVQKGSAVSIKKVSEVQDMEYSIRKDLVVRGLVAKNTFDSIAGVSTSILQAKECAATYAKYDSSILIYGETGTGKELFAQSIHNASKRKNHPFVAINCATLPESLIESELFGYVKGAFTGANKDGKQGLFEIADKGTIFLDEINKLSLPMQPRLLRVLQEGEIIRVGGDRVIHVDTRVICSSNEDLLQLVKEGKFKIDLYYRLCVLEINILPLRERPEDIEYTAYAILRGLAEKYNKNILKISDDVLSLLTQMEFPGNVRELRNLIERMVIMADGNVLDMKVLQSCGLRPDTPASAQSLSEPRNIRAAQKELILDALTRCRGNKAAAARMLGINPSTLYRKMKTYGL